MSAAVQSVWRQLLQRRLLPVAILLIAAAAAIPFILAKDPETTPAAPLPAAGKGPDELATEPIVTAADGATLKRRKVLGSARNPFAAPASAPQAESPADPAGKTPAADEPASEAPSSSGGGAPSGGGDEPVVPSGPSAPSTPSTPKPQYDRGDLTVRFGDATGDALERMTVKRLGALPSVEEPVLIYLGVADGGKSAVFLFEEGVEVNGDAECDPSPQACETIKLRAGETEFVDVKGEDGEVALQFQLDLVKIHGDFKRSTAAAAKASGKPSKRARRAARAGRRALAARAAAGHPAPYRFDRATGTLKRVSDLEYRAVLLGALKN